MTMWEGGVRGLSFVHHGDPAFFSNMRGAVWDGMMHGTDYFVSVLTLAGVSAVAIRTDTGPLPPDGMDVFAAREKTRNPPCVARFCLSRISFIADG